MAIAIKLNSPDPVFHRAICVESASSYEVIGINGVSFGHAYSCFLEFEIERIKKFVEVIAVGEEPILGQNLINEFKIEIDDPSQLIKLSYN